MRIIIDGRWLGRTGIGRYVQALLDELQRLDAVNEYLVLQLPDQKRLWEPEAPNFRIVETKVDVYTRQEQTTLRRELKALMPDLVHFTSFNAPALYGGRFVVTVHDLTLVHFRNTKSGFINKIKYEFKYWAMRGILKRIIKNAAHILVPTRFGKDDLLAHYHVRPENVSITPESVGQLVVWSDDVSRLDLPDEFIMYVGNYYPYKNINRLIDGFAKTAAAERGTKLVLAGNTPYFTDQAKAHAAKVGAEDHIIFAGRVTDGELTSLYKRTALYVFPSLHEGFGLPGLEAMAQGAPVLAARASCLPEVYGEAAAFFNPNDTADITKQIDALLNDKDRRQELAQAGREHIKQYSWAKMAAQTLAAYRSATEPKR